MFRLARVSRTVATLPKARAPASAVFASPRTRFATKQHNPEIQTFDHTKSKDGVKSKDIVWSEGLFSTEERFQMTGHRGCTLWLTGLSGSGKSTIACALEARILREYKVHCFRLDGDNVRFGLNKDLGFSEKDRSENIRRIGEVAKLFADSGSIAITAFISPYRAGRDETRAMHDAGKLPFFEVHTEVPLSVAEERDPKGLYKKARAGTLKNFTGIDKNSPYEIPLNPDINIPTHKLNVDQCVDMIISHLSAKGILKKK